MRWPFATERMMDENSPKTQALPASLKSSITQQKIAAPSAHDAPTSSPRTTAVWDRLSIFFLGLSLLIAIYAVRGLYSDPPLILPASAESGPFSRITALAGVGGQEVSSFDEFAPVFSSRDIFRSPTPGDAWPDKEGSPASNWGTEYKLVGVMMDAHPRAVVEVSQPRSVQFLSVGGHLGDAVVEKIESKTVWFRYHGQQVQLTLGGSQSP